MNAKKNNNGFTMAEMLITVAILAVLAGLAFIGIARYQKSMHQLEMDAIAKEIFVAAQNHLSLANSQGFPNVDDFGSDDKEGGNGIYYFVYGGPDGENPFEDEGSLIRQMLPLGSVDPTVLGRGSFIIRYLKAPAIVLDVFYDNASGRFGHAFTAAEYTNVIPLRDERNEDGTIKIDRKANRIDCLGNKAVIGWYGGDGLQSGAQLEAPSIDVKNADKLTVEITVKNDANAVLNLLVTGLSSKAEKVYRLTTTAAEPRCTTEAVDSEHTKYTVVLDDITEKERHFGNIVPDRGTFYIGENISLQAKWFSTSVLTNVATSELRITNSVFDTATTVEKEEGSPFTANAVISNIRHLENLNKEISGCGKTVNIITFRVKEAVQTADLSWLSFPEAGHAGVNIFELDPLKAGVSYFRAIQLAADLQYDGGYHSITGVDENGHAGVNIFELDAETGVPYFRAIQLAGDLQYDGGYHSITDVVENESGSAGLFMALPSGSSVSNLELAAFTIAGGSDSGILAGAAEDTKITNVLVSGNAVITPNAQNSGYAGGLIGRVNGTAAENSAINKCASTAKIVSASEKSFSVAGGLVGYAENTGVKESYSAGHVIKDEYQATVNFTYDPSTYDINASGSAGGLVGSAKNTTVSFSYSTCSVSGTPAGGFIGSGTGEDMNIDQCYCTGRIDRTKASVGAFAGTLGGTASGLYYEIINEKDQDGKIDYLKAVNGNDYLSSGTTTITALDADLTSYQDFVKSPTDWKPAKPANSDLDSFYNHKYSLETVQQLGGTSTTVLATDYVFTHYGDWPAPETLVINVK